MAKSKTKQNANAQQPAIAVVMGSETDLPTMKAAVDALGTFNIPTETRILSAHRTPKDVADFATKARKSGIKVIIAGAGGAAHLPGMIASYTELPVIGVPVGIGPLQGVDALYSIVQMPRGVPVATVAIGNAWNAGILAAQMLGDSEVLDQVRKYKDEMGESVRRKSTR